MQQDLAARHILAVAKRISPLLAGLPAGMQGAILAELTATWLWGHQVAGNMAATDQLREDIFTAHNDAVRGLLAIDDVMSEPDLPGTATV